ncbi:MAG: succinate--CoA ligase subunit alpha [Marinifilaceae bacterium]|jgi:succinyl-CoA synthetase alpha subunit|nr:succinate--CoA ligase subunit alpha [Marinifilaceae bacterium]
MSILVNKDTKLLVQGITGSEGSFHTKQMIEYGTNVVAGVTPGKGGLKFNDSIPIYNTVEKAVVSTNANSSVIFVPPAYSADAIMESAMAGIKLIVCITEGVPTMDMLKVKEFLKDYPDTVLIGPNCPGIISPGLAKIGIMPGFIHKPGKVGIISRSGTLTYEAVHQLVNQGLGQSTAIGIGGDPIIGTRHIDAVKLFNEDADTEAIVLIGEIGGNDEEIAAEYISKYVNKPVVAFIAGQTAPKGKRMGHAGAIINGKQGSAADKMHALESAGISVVKSPAEIGKKMKELLSK